MKELFEDLIQRGYTTPFRPLNELSDYVVEQLPVDLQQIREGHKDPMDIARQAETLVTATNQSTADIKAEEVATLDLKILEAAIVHSGLVPGGKLQAAVTGFSRRVNQPAVITYEEIIMLNPTTDRRTFTSGKVGDTELGFYEGHRRMEQHLATVINLTKDGIKRLSVGDSSQRIGEKLQEGASDLTRFVEYMHAIRGGMDPSDFAIFRQYLTSHPLRGIPTELSTLAYLKPLEPIPQEHMEFLKDTAITGLKGPSGAFTARVPVLDILLSGKALPADFFKYLEINRMYFPKEGRSEIDEVITLTARDHSLRDLIRQLDNPPELVTPFETMSSMMRRFRGAHYGAVKRHVPQAISGKVTGTGGELNPGTFLRKRMEIKHYVS